MGDLDKTRGKNVLRRDFYDGEGGDVQTKRFILKKDIIIPAGTEFHPAPCKTVRFQDGHATAHVGLTDDTCGEFDYFIDPDDLELEDWFQEVKE
jgi:hypothetical protein